ncbi:hypothetical protein F4809DRAFT_643126 [Biscogniauxia mediterranea]|nr:hypothetical protein F4809DRAFT_643126 [Biscogniauxia mediterranea]
MAYPAGTCHNYPPDGYHSPRFPSLCWPPESRGCALYSVFDSWRFTLLWTLMLYALFHLGATGVALFMQVGKRRSVWKYLVAVPFVYFIIAGVEALVAGSIVGAVFVTSFSDPRYAAVYIF